MKQSKKKQPRRVFLEGNHCLPDSTEVLVRGRGWVFIPEVVKGDVVLSLEGWCEATETHEVHYEGDMYRIGGRSTGVVMTSDHRVYYSGSSGQMQVKMAKDCPTTLDLPVSTIVGNGVDLTNEQLQFNAIAATDSYHRKGGGIVFYQSGDKADVVEGIIKACGVEYRRVTRNRDITHICGVELKSQKVSYEFHILKKPEWCVEDNKSLPDWCFDMNEDQFKVFFDMLIFCDGSIPTRATSSRVFYGRKKICDDLQALCVSKGHRATLTEYRDNQWRVNICKTTKCRASKDNLGVFKGLVYCLTTTSGNFMIRQGDRPCFTGNCHRIKKVLEYEPHLAGERYGISYSNLQLNDYYQDVVMYEGGTPGIINLDGISFAHFMVSGLMGRPVGGEHHASSLLAKNYSSCVVGHSHTADFAIRSGSNGKTIMGLVCGVYQDYNSGWAGNCNNLWWRGLVYLKNVEDGVFEPEFISIESLRKAYGK